MRFPKVILRFAFIVALAAASSTMYGQASSSMTGVVTDSTGAVIPGTVVTLSNKSTGVKYNATTDASGSYRFAIVPPNGGYTVSFSHPGFAVTTVNDVTLQIAITRTQDVKLAAGTVTEVEVQAGNSEVTLNTTDATIGNNFDVKMVNELPVQDRSSVQILFALEPGVSPTGSVTGARSDQNSVTLDGMDINDIAAGQAQAVGSTFNTVGGAPADAVQEFRGIVAGLPSVTGTGSGGQFQLITKSGTNRFHGNLNEYHRDVSTTANSWFNLNTIPALPRPKLIRNQFGGNIGGPIWRDKLFFFFDFNNGRTIQQSSTSRTVPLDSFRNGIIGYTNNSSASCTSASRRSSAPSCITDFTPAQVKALDPQLVGESGTLFTYINSRYPHANDLSLGDGINTGGYRFQQSTNQNLYNYVGRLDYNIGSKQRVFLQYHTIRTDGVQALNQFDVDPLTFPNQNRSYGYVGSHIWNIGNNKVNQFYYGDNIQIAKFPVNFNPTNNVGYTFGPLTAPNGSLSSQNRRIPVPEFRDDFNWTIGRHTLQFGGTFKFIKTNSRLTNDFPSIAVGIGGLNTALDASLRPADINTNSTVLSRYDSAFTFSLARIASESRNYNYDASGTPLPSGTGAVRRYRYYQTETYFGDTWKATPDLTLTFGLRYQYYSAPFEANGIQSNPDISFNDYFYKRVAANNAGTTGATAAPLISYNLGGKANNAGDIYSPSVKDLGPRFGFSYNPSVAKKTVINGSFGLDFDRTVINAVNFVQDQLSYLFQNTQTSLKGSGVSATQALLTDARLGANLSFPAVPGGVTISKPFTPYSTGGVPFGTTQGQSNYVVDKNLKTPYSLAFNLGMQQQIKGGFIVNASYVGRLGRRLLGQADASQLLDYRDPISGQSLSQAFANLSAYLRANPTATQTLAGRAAIPQQPWFTNVSTAPTSVNVVNRTVYTAVNSTSNVQIGNIADTIAQLATNSYIPKNVGFPGQFLADTFITNLGYSAYHGALLTLTKNTSHGLEFQFNYTFSHSTDNESAVANNIGLNTLTNQVCDILVRNACYGNSDFDIKHLINSNFVYALPFGRGRQYGANMNRFLDLAVGGWSVSGIPTWRSGLAFNTQSGAFLAGDSNNVAGTFNGDRNAIKVRLHKDANGAQQLFDNPTTAAAAFTNPLGFQYGSRNVLRGPTATTFDAGVSKRFNIIQEKLNFQLRGDGFNVLNHPTFSTPSGVNYNNGSTFGQVTTVATGARVIQISGRLEF